jgi:hypothetical protein
MWEDDKQNNAIRIKGVQLADLRRQAAAENMTLSQYVNKLLRDYLDRLESEDLTDG